MPRGVGSGPSVRRSGRRGGAIVAGMSASSLIGRDREFADALIEHLTAALGVGKRTRRAAGSAERARSAVTHRLRTTVRQLGRLHPLLGRHLTHAVNTGTYCSYRPEMPTVWHIG